MLITGAGAGIGYACARALAARGADLILSDNDGPALERTANSCHALGLFCDVASEASVAIFGSEVRKSFASLDVIINAAGRSYIRTLGTMRIIRAFLPMMRGDGGPKHIINFAPSGGIAPAECPFPYAASRDAFDRLSEALVQQVRGTKVAISSIVPRTAPAARSGPVSSQRYIVERYDPDQVAAEVMSIVLPHRVHSTDAEPQGQRQPRAS